jgi:hypothetical protein
MWWCINIWYYMFCIEFQKITPEMTKFLEKLKERVPVALVGGSDLVKIAEQMGDAADSHGMNKI